MNTSEKPNDGGPAFPWHHPAGDDACGKHHPELYHGGASLRAYMATKILAGIVSVPLYIDGKQANLELDKSRYARIAVTLADALMRQLEG